MGMQRLHPPVLFYPPPCPSVSRQAHTHGAVYIRIDIWPHGAVKSLCCWFASSATAHNSLRMPHKHGTQHKSCQRKENTSCSLHAAPHGRLCMRSEWVKGRKLGTLGQERNELKRKEEGKKYPVPTNTHVQENARSWIYLFFLPPSSPLFPLPFDQIF